jgi:Phage portal protein, SPP1 Gp6-like
MYYEGFHETKVLSERTHQTLKRMPHLSTMFSNYCALAVDAPCERLQVTGFKGDAADDAQELWDDNDLHLESEELHRHVVCAGEAFLLVWPSETEAGDFDVVVQDARNIHMEYGPRRQQDKQWAAKVYLDTSDPTETQWTAILYYPNEIHRLVAPPTMPARDCPLDVLQWDYDDDDPGGLNPLGAVPLIRFARFWDSASNIDNLIPIQDRINKLTGDKIVAAEFAAFPQRYALTNDNPPPDALRASPGLVWVIPPSSSSAQGGQESETKVGQFPITPLKNYDDAIREEVMSFWSVGHLPRHMLIDPGVAPSAQAVLADDSPFVAYARGFLRVIASGYKELFKLVSIDAEPVWQDVEVRNELTSAQTMQALTTAGMPLRLAAEIALDLSEDQLEELDNLPVPPQPGAAVPGQMARGAPASQTAPGPGKPEQGRQTPEARS